MCGRVTPVVRLREKPGNEFIKQEKYDFIQTIYEIEEYERGILFSFGKYSRIFNNDILLLIISIISWILISLNLHNKYPLFFM